MTTKYEIIGKVSNACKVIETVTVPKAPQATIISCLLDNSKSFKNSMSDSSKCKVQ